MAAIKFQKETEEWHIFQDYYSLCQGIWITEQNDNYWDSVRSAVKEFHDKYDCPFSKQLGLALLNTLEQKEKEQIKVGDKN